MSVDDDDPRHLQVARALQHENEQAWIRERHRCDNLVRDNDQLRADLATVTAEREALRWDFLAAFSDRAQMIEALATERAAHEADRELAEAWQARDRRVIESTRAALAKAEARVKKLEAFRGQCLHFVTSDDYTGNQACIAIAELIDG